MKRQKLAALLGAGLLTFAVTGVAFANSLGTDKPHMVAPTTLDELISDQGVSEDCTDFTGDLAVGDGQVGIHFILTSPESDSGNISGDVDGVAFGPIANTVHGQGQGQGNASLQWYVIVDGDGSSVINDATTDVNGDVLTVSHLCFGAEATATPEATPTTEATPSAGVGGDTNNPTQPPTDSLLGSSGPTDTAWLLVVALGVLLASVVVLTPARAKNRR
jgi:hypothetical protein